MRFVENLALKKGPDQIIEDKLSSNLRKSKARSDRAHQAVQDAKQASNASTKRGQTVIRQRQRAEGKADVSVARHSNVKLEHEANKTVLQRHAPLRRSSRRRI